jgi:serine/threonine-protein kinase RsbW
MYQMEKCDEHIKIKASASYNFMEKMCLEVENFSKEKNFESRRFALMLCLREALTNAIRHGSKNNSEKQIFMQVDYINDTMKILIRDEGNGFNWREVEANNINNLNLNGRGRSIIDLYSDSYEYNEKGNQIKISIKND